MTKFGSSGEFQYSKVPIKENDKKLEDAEIPSTFGYGYRHIQLLIFFLCLVTSFTARGHLGVTLVAMTSPQNPRPTAEGGLSLAGGNCTNFNSSKEVVDCLGEKYIDFDGSHITTFNDRNETADNNNYYVEDQSIYKVYNWSKPIQEMVLTSFFLGYSLMMLPIAMVCQRWGGKVPLQLGLFVNGVVTMLTPWLAYWGGWQVVCVCRLLQGMSQSGVFPGIQTLLAQWVPAKEKATLTSYVYTGATTGSVFGFLIAGILSHSFGWPVTFWTIGFLCLLTFGLLTVFGAASPRTHKKISKEEKNYILGHAVTPVVLATKVPWKAMATSKPLWGNYATVFGSVLSFIFFFTQVPTYIHYIYGIDVKSSGMLSSLPYIVSIFASLAFGVISDYLTNNNILSIKNARRLSNTVSQVGVAVSLIGASYASTTTIAVFWFVVFMVSHMGTHTGWMVNQIDMAPNYSGTLMALGSMMANLLSIVMPFIISNIVVDMQNVYQWRIMLYLEAALAFVPAMIFVIFISADVQPWNDGGGSDAEIKGLNLETAEKNKEHGNTGNTTSGSTVITKQ